MGKAATTVDKRSARRPQGATVWNVAFGRWPMVINSLAGRQCHASAAMRTAANNLFSSHCSNTPPLHYSSAELFYWPTMAAKFR